MTRDPIRTSLGGVARGAAAGAVLGFLLRDLLPLETASAWVVPTLVGALLGRTRLHVAVVGLTLASALVWALVAFGPVAKWTSSGLVRRDPPRPVSVVFVLGSRVQADGEPTAAALSRLLRGVELVAEGRARVLAVGEPPPAGSHVSVARRLASSLGVEADEIVPVGPVRSTRDEALRVSRLARERGWERLLVVTSPLHTRRACAALEHEGVDVVCAPAGETEFDVETLDRPLERLVAFRRALRERLALWVYGRRGWLEAS